jgi:hypothetical protein
MKKIYLLLAFMVLLVFSSAFAKPSSNPADVEAVKQVIHDYVKGTDTRDVGTLEKLLYPSGNFYNYNKLTDKTSEMTNDQFLDQVKKGVAGGWIRQLNINSVDVNDNTAMAEVEITDARIKQYGYLTLVKENGNWKIMSGAYTLESAK